MESKHKIALIGDFLLRWKQQQRCWLEDQGHIIGFADFVLCSSYNIYMNIKHIRTLGIFQSNQVMETSLNVKVEKEFGAAFYWVTGASLNNFPTWDTLPLQRTFSSKSRKMKIPRQNLPRLFGVLYLCFNVVTCHAICCWGVICVEGREGWIED